MVNALKEPAFSWGQKLWAANSWLLNHICSRTGATGVVSVGWRDQGGLLRFPACEQVLGEEWTLNWCRRDKNCSKVRHSAEVKSGDQGRIWVGEIRRPGHWVKWSRVWGSWGLPAFSSWCRLSGSGVAGSSRGAQGNLETDIETRPTPSPGTEVQVWRLRGGKFCQD